MRIALLTDGIAPYVTGGMQRHSFNLCKFLASNGVYVDLYHCDPNNRIKDGLKVFSSDELNFINSILIKFPDLGKMPGHYLRESYEYSRLISIELGKRPAVDFIYAKGFTAWSLLHLRDQRKIKLPPVGVNFHGYEMFQRQTGLIEKLKAKWLLRSPVRYNVTNADLVFSYGGKITDIIASLGVNRNKIVEVPGAVEESWLIDAVRPANKPVHFLFVGRAEPRKGLSELLSAYEKAFTEVTEKPQLTIIGAHKIKRNISGVKIICEQTDQSALMKLYRSADVLVVPSFSEGFPNVILEGMASGLAIIATDTGAVRLLVDSENGWLVNSPDPQLLKNVLLEAANLSHESLISKKRNSLSKVKAEFTWNVTGTKLLNILNQQIGNNVML